MAKDNRKDLVKLAEAAVKKAFRGSITGSAIKQLELPSMWAGTGSYSLDRLCAGYNPGGIPMGPRYGRIVHIAGEWSTGKSLLLDHIVKSVIVSLNGLAKISETEGSRDPHFASAIGLPLDLLSIDRPDTMEQMFDMFIEWHDAIRAEDEEIPIIWGIDSLDSTEAEKAANKGLSEGGGWHYGGGRAEALGAGLKKITRIVSRYPTTLIMLNQTRDNIGVMFGPKKRTPGGNPPHFYASLELMLSGCPRPDKGYIRDNRVTTKLSKEAIKRLGLYDLDDGAVIGRYIRAKVTKTKMAATLDTHADFYIDFRRGIHPWEGLAERLIFEGVLKTGEDGASNYEMTVPPGLLSDTGSVARFDTKKDWLNWLVRNMEALRGTNGVRQETSDVLRDDKAAKEAE